VEWIQLTQDRTVGGVLWHGDEASSSGVTELVIPSYKDQLVNNV
jgi:hypothetical protein